MIEITFKFYANGGTFDSDNSTSIKQENPDDTSSVYYEYVYSDDTAAITLDMSNICAQVPAPTHNPQVFAGWYTNAKSVNPNDEFSGMRTYTESKVETIFAGWSYAAQEWTRNKQLTYEDLNRIEQGLQDVDARSLEYCRSSYQQLVDMISELSTTLSNEISKLSDELSAQISDHTAQISGINNSLGTGVEDENLTILRRLYSIDGLQNFNSVALLMPGYSYGTNRKPTFKERLDALDGDPILKAKSENELKTTTVSLDTLEKGIIKSINNDVTELNETVEGYESFDENNNMVQVPGLVDKVQTLEGNVNTLQSTTLLNAKTLDSGASLPANPNDTDLYFVYLSDSGTNQ